MNLYVLEHDYLPMTDHAKHDLVYPPIIKPEQKQSRITSPGSKTDVFGR